MTQIRNATEGDIGPFKEIIESSISEFCKDYYTSTQIDSLLGQYPGPALYQKWLTERVLIVAEDETGIVGFAQFHPSSSSIEAVHVSPNRARGGIGRQLLNAIEAIAKNQGILKITLDASLNAAGFYSRCGYTRKEISSYRCKNGIELKTIRYEKGINSQQE